MVIKNFAREVKQPQDHNDYYLKIIIIKKNLTCRILFFALYVISFNPSDTKMYTNPGLSCTAT